MSESGMSDKAVLSCRNLGKSYEEGPESVVVLSGLQLELHPGERVAIVGSSGSGKVPCSTCWAGWTRRRRAVSGWLAKSCRRWEKRLAGCCAIGRWVSFTSSTICCPNSPRLKNVCMPLLIGRTPISKPASAPLHCWNVSASVIVWRTNLRSCPAAASACGDCPCLDQSARSGNA